ncbi:MAG: pyridoxal-dependent decarboxylase [Bacteroidota bacterium]|mgnify:CR=1 FL=1
MIHKPTALSPRLREAYDPENFRRLGHQLVDQLADHLQNVQSEVERPVYHHADPEAETEYWRRALDRSGLDQLPDWYARVVQHSIHLHHPRYAGHQISSPSPLAALSGLLTDLLNNGMGVYEMGVAATAMERVVIETVARQFGMPATAGGYLTSGGTLANLTALLAARRHRAPRDVWREGSNEKLAVLVCEEAHYCIDRAVRIMGLGEAGVRKIPATKDFKMRTELLEEHWQQARAEGLYPIAVVGSACSTSTGAYDDLEAIADFCEAKQLWFHVDGAHGAAVAFSGRYCQLVKGIDRADSVTMDFHKMLLTPALATGLIFRELDASFATFSQRAQYLWSGATDREWFNLARRTFECTKSMMSVKVFTLLQAYGTDLFDDYVSRCYDLGQYFAQLISQSPDLELATWPDGNIVCFRRMVGDLDEEGLNQLNGDIRRSIVESGAFYLVQTELHGRCYLRVTLVNPLTSEEDLEELLNLVRRRV